jgi:hypothetical protein
MGYASFAHTILLEYSTRDFEADVQTHYGRKRRARNIGAGIGAATLGTAGHFAGGKTNKPFGALAGAAVGAAVGGVTGVKREKQRFANYQYNELPKKYKFVEV